MESCTDENIISINCVNDEELISLYSNAYGVISASFYEGFGIPLIEARFFNCPRLFCSDIPVYRELNPTNTIYFDTLDVNDIQRKVFKEFISHNNTEATDCCFFSPEVPIRQFKFMIESIGRN